MLKSCPYVLLEEGTQELMFSASAFEPPENEASGRMSKGYVGWATLAMMDIYTDVIEYCLTKEGVVWMVTGQNNARAGGHGYQSNSPY